MSLLTLSIIVYAVVVTILTVGFVVLYKVSGNNKALLMGYVALEGLLTLGLVAWLFLSGAISLQ